MVVVTLTFMRCPRTTARLCARRVMSASDCAWYDKVMVAGVTGFVIANLASAPSITTTNTNSSRVKPAAARFLRLLVCMVRFAWRQ